MASLVAACRLGAALAQHSLRHCTRANSVGIVGAAPLLAPSVAPVTVRCAIVRLAHGGRAFEAAPRTAVLEPASVSLWRQLMARVPKGFENFFPKKKSSPKSSGNKSSKSSKKESGEEGGPAGGGGGGGGDKDPLREFWSNPQNRTTVMALVGAALLMSVFSSGPGMRETDWQGFRRDYLDKGLVERLVVANKSHVKVFLVGNNNTGPAMFFTIGSVESFERQLERAQNDLNISPDDHIPVTYVSETSIGAELAKLLPTLLLLGALLYVMRRASGGMGGMGGNAAVMNLLNMGRAGMGNMHVMTDDYADEEADVNYPNGPYRGQFL
eukprot:m.387806 g.387806  ORF g.387806 m.387806 type:complete len:326 (+) comp20066_c14_seq3:465-1442(+)